MYISDLAICKWPISDSWEVNELVKQISYDLQRPGELDADIECQVERLCIMLTNLELLYPNARSLVSPLLDSTKSIFAILKSENTNFDKKMFLDFN